MKIMRLFLFSPELGFDSKDVASKSKIPIAVARKEISFLKSIDFMKRGKFYREEKRKKGKKTFLKKIKFRGWTLNKDFAYVKSLRDLLIDSKFLEREEILKRFRGSGRIKLLIISGIFIKEDNSRIDIMIVGDNLKRAAIERSLKSIESEIGKELRYAVLDTKEFSYRLDMYDKFIRDVLDYPHERLIEKIKVE